MLSHWDSENVGMVKNDLCGFFWEIYPFKHMLVIEIDISNIFWQECIGRGSYIT